MSSYYEKNAKWCDHSANTNNKGSSSGAWTEDKPSWHRAEAAAARNKEPEKSDIQPLQDGWWDVNQADVKPTNLMQLADDKVASQQTAPMANVEGGRGTRGGWGKRFVAELRRQGNGSARGTSTRRAGAGTS